jgi:hypothetical protein
MVYVHSYRLNGDARSSLVQKSSSYRWEGHHVVVSQNAGNEWYDLLHMLFLLNAYSFVQLVAHKTGVECFLMNAAAWKLKEVF